MICCFFKQKTAYEMRISDWSSDVCSSDLALHAVLIDVAETRALPAAEGVVGDRHRDRHVDADHADVDAGGEFARGMAVARENRDAVAILMARGQRQRFLEILRADNLEDRAENILLVCTHPGRAAIEKRRTDEACGRAPCRERGGQNMKSRVVSA